MFISFTVNWASLPKHTRASRLCGRRFWLPYAVLEIQYRFDFTKTPMSLNNLFKGMQDLFSLILGGRSYYMLLHLLLID